MIRRLRLSAGLVMLTYVTMHLLNHATGLVSLAAMEATLAGVVLVWSNLPAQVLLYGSFTVHYALALYALWQRRSLRLQTSELAQVVLGFALPILLVRHVVANRVAHDYFGADTGHYAFVLYNYFVRRPDAALQQMLVLVVAWTHAMIGLYYWLRLRRWFARVQPMALLIAVLVPVLALLGMIAGGREVLALADDPAWVDEMMSHVILPSPQAGPALDRIGTLLGWGFAACLAAVLAARVARREWQRRAGLVRIAYPDGRFIDVVPGTSVLEASRLARVPHASVCGGRGRCSTCRVRARGASDAFDPPAETEARVLRRISATPNVRLACQLRPRRMIEVTPLLPPFAPAADAGRPADLMHGRERELAILFADLRGFTTFAEGRLPYDVVFVLNRYFAATGRAVETAGGHIDKFIGDGVMALFGIETDAATACRQALAAARLMPAYLAELNRSLRDDLDEPLRIGIGIHVGPVIIGEMGYGGAAAMTAIGDAVNTANRLEGLTKELDCQLVVSEETAARAGVDLTEFPRHLIELRGKRELLAVRTVDDAARLPDPRQAREKASGVDAIGASVSLATRLRG